MTGVAPFQVMAKPIGPKCNMNCTYCFYLEKKKMFSYDNTAGKSEWVMSDDVLEKYIKQKLESKDFSEETFVWQGGEPTLLGVDYFRNIVKIQEKYNNGKKIKNALQTNGILLNDKWCEFFAENNFLIGISIDGPREIHDKCRTDRSGKSTFYKVMHGLSILKKHHVEFNTLTTVHRWNSAFPLEIYHFLKETGSTYMQFIPVVERITEPKDCYDLSLTHPADKDAVLTEWSVESEQYGKFLISIFDEWVRNDVGNYFIQIFDVSLEAWYGMPSSLCIFNKTCGLDPAIEHNGDLYSCDHYVYPEYKVGNILNNSLQSIMQSHRQIKFGKDKSDTLPQFCIECKFHFVCNGECPKNRISFTENGEFGLNYLCAGYKLFFEHIDSFMRFMVDELRNKRPPANVMSWIIEKEKDYPLLKKIEVK